MFAKEFFVEIARPLYERHQMSPDSEELLWASVVAMNHVTDYRGRDGATPSKDPSLDLLRTIAEAFKHANPHRTGKKADPTSVSDNFFLIPNVLAEPNILASWTIEIDGKRCSIGPVLKSVVEFWSKELGVP